jgi:hypothetical protein
MEPTQPTAVTRIAAAEHPLTMITIYNRPKDYPDRFVLREHYIANGRTWPSQTVYGWAPTLEKARSLLPHGMANLGRQPADDPVIVETWV